MGDWDRGGIAGYPSTPRDPDVCTVLARPSRARGDPAAHTRAAACADDAADAPLVRRRPTRLLQPPGGRDDPALRLVARSLAAASTGPRVRAQQHECLQGEGHCGGAGPLGRQPSPGPVHDAGAHDHRL